jgi:hypothetical protein
MRRATRSLERSDARFALGIVAGLVLFNVIIFILPLSYAAWISFRDRDVILRTQEFIWLGHYRRILTSPEAIAAILLSIKFTAVVVAASLIVARQRQQPLGCRRQSYRRTLCPGRQRGSAVPTERQSARCPNDQAQPHRT